MKVGTNTKPSEQREAFLSCVLKNFAIFTGKHLCRSLLLIKFQTRDFIQKSFQNSCFLVNIAKFLSFFIKHFQWLILRKVWIWNPSTHFQKINPFQAKIPFLYPLQTSENLGFLTFSGGRDMKHWLKMG